MVTPRPSLWRTLAIITTTVLSCLFLASCGNGPARSSATENVGPGGLTVGQDRNTLEQANPKWTTHKVIVYDTSTLVVYRDYHWSLARGFAHSAEYHHVTFGHDQRVMSWVSNSNPNSTRE